MSAGNTFVPGAICFDWTASFGVLCLGVAEFTWAEGSSYSVVWESLRLRNLVQSCPL